MELVGDQDAFASVQDQILSCRGYGNMSDDVLAPVAAFLNASTSCFLQVAAKRGGTANIRRSAIHNVSEEAHRGYLAYHTHNDPAISAATRNSHRIPYVFCTSEVADYSSLTRSEFYNVFFRPNRIHHVLAMSLRSHVDDDDIIMLGFHRPPNEKPFGEAEKGMLHSLSAALSCSVRVLCLEDELHIRDLAMTEYDKEYQEHGLLFFDENLALLHGNQVGIGHLQSSLKPDTPRFDLLARACRRAAMVCRDDEAIAFDFSEADDVIAKVRAVHDYDGRQLFAVHTNNRMTEAIFSARCREYGFSLREVDIVRTLAAGLSNVEIGERLFISVRTVENHLRSIYSKAHVNRRTQLLSRLNGSG